jgi:hypothetical protein
MYTVAISDSLNRKLPQGYFAEMHVHAGGRPNIEIGLSDGSAAPFPIGSLIDQKGDVATLEAPVWAPPKPAISMPAIFPDSVEVLVYNSESGATLVAAVELVSPGNKDRPEARSGFAAKCATYLQQGVGLIIVDVVTTRSTNLHDDLIELLMVGPKFKIPFEGLYATAYRPVRRPTDEHIDVWPAGIRVGERLPLLPLSLDRGICLPLDLEPPYVEACERSRLAVQSSK